MADDPLVLLTGPQLMGSLLSFFLSGAFAMQVYHYHMHYAHSDRWLFVILVFVVVVIEMVHMFMATHLTYYLLAYGYGNPRTFDQTPWSGAVLPALNGLVGLCTQAFLAWRIITLTKTTESVTLGKIISGTIFLTAGMQCAAAFGVTIQYSLLSRQLHLLRTLKTTVIVWLAGSVVCDTMITVSMVALLLRARGTTSLGGSKNMINALIIHAIESGAITTMAALVTLLTYLVLPDTLYYGCFEYLLGRLYANVLLASLNGRNRMRAIGDVTITDFEQALGKSTLRPPAEVSQVQFRLSFRSDDTANEYELRTRAKAPGAVYDDDQDSESDSIDDRTKGNASRTQVEDQYPCQ
ncbi:hypothetical protein MD484_g6076, partial [Candolleomyces efflorescens]